jgi:hypothetical protein
VQVFSIDDCTDLTVTGITIDGTAGDSLGANTDGFDIGSSTSVTISGANVYNQVILILICCFFLMGARAWELFREPA